MSILIVGSVAFDSIKTPFGECKGVLGGSAVYSSISARFFSPVRLVSVVGNDFPRRHISLLKKQGIDIEGLSMQDGKTFFWEGEYGWDMNDAKTIATHLNVFSSFNPVIPAFYKDSRFIFLANIDPVLQREVLSQLKSPRLVLVDTMNYWIENKRRALLELIKDVDVFLLNESEARQLSGNTSLIKAIDRIQKMGPGIVIVKRGEHGVIMRNGRELFYAPAYLLESAYDPTGAGDAFAGGVVGYIAQSKKINRNTLRKAVIYGSIMATFAVESFSVRKLASITRKDIEGRYKNFISQTCF